MNKTPSKLPEPEVRQESIFRGSPKNESESTGAAYITPPKEEKSKDSRDCRRSSNCGNCHRCKENKSSGAHPVEDKCIKRECVKFKLSSSNCHDSDGSSSDEEQNHTTRQTGGSSGEMGEMQCYGPGCFKTALPHSKYCSDICGLNLATIRILQVLPQRLEEWSMTTSHAESVNMKDLETIARKLEQARALMEELNMRYQRLEDIIAKGKELKPEIDPELNKKVCVEKTNNHGRKEKEANIYCVTCGCEIRTSSAIKHMEKCFSKYESQAFLGPTYETSLFESVFLCNFYNPVSNTYCDRLKAICPGHTKDSNEACGCPLVKDVFEETAELCRSPKKTCFEHYGWEKLRRAEIVMEKGRQMLRIKELHEQQKQIRQQLDGRKGVLALMLHSTFNHENKNKMTESQEEERLGS